MKEKDSSLCQDNRLFVSVIAVLMVIFLLLLWMTCGASNSMEAETSYTDVTALSTSSSNKVHSLFLRRLPSQRPKEVEKLSQKVTVDVKGAVVNPRCLYAKGKALG